MWKFKNNVTKIKIIIYLFLSTEFFTIKMKNKVTLNCIVVIKHFVTMQYIYFHCSETYDSVYCNEHQVPSPSKFSDDSDFEASISDYETLKKIVDSNDNTYVKFCNCYKDSVELNKSLFNFIATQGYEIRRINQRKPLSESLFFRYSEEPLQILNNNYLIEHNLFYIHHIDNDDELTILIKLPSTSVPTNDWKSITPEEFKETIKKGSLIVPNSELMVSKVTKLLSTTNYTIKKVSLKIKGNIISDYFIDTHALTKPAVKYQV